MDETFVGTDFGTLEVLSKRQIILTAGLRLIISSNSQHSIFTTCESSRSVPITSVSASSVIYK